MEQEKRGCLAVLLGSASKPAEPRRSAVTFPYRLKASFLSPAEIAFQRVVASGFSPKYTVFPKVRVLDLCDVVDRQQNQAAFNRIDRKHLDFLLCDPGTFKPILAIELDDATHRRSDRADRDAFVDEVLRVIGLPLVRFQAQRDYDKADLIKRIESAIASRASTTS
jgi:very-short-patch-repair endonuclease